MTFSLRLFTLFATLCSMISCGMAKKVPYMQDAASYNRQKIIEGYQIRIGNDDVLSIVVSSKDTVLARPFNRTSAQGYLVSTSGNIDFPVFGRMNVVGQTPAMVADSIRKRLVAEGFIRDAAVSAKLMNFKISVMGEVSKPGVFPIAGERVTLLEALTLAGDMSIYGRRDKILIVREENGERDLHYVDVNSTSLFSSPYYYLRQNDLVYVEPNTAKTAESEYNTRMPMILTAASVITSLVSLIVLISK